MRAVPASVAACVMVVAVSGVSLTVVSGAVSVSVGVVGVVSGVGLLMVVFFFLVLLFLGAPGLLAAGECVAEGAGCDGDADG